MIKTENYSIEQISRALDVIGLINNEVIEQDKDTTIFIAEDENQNLKTVYLMMDGAYNVFMKDVDAVMWNYKDNLHAYMICFEDNYINENKSINMSA